MIEKTIHALRPILLLALTGFFAASLEAAEPKLIDDFDKDKLSRSLWDRGFQSGRGKLEAKNGALTYTVSEPSGGKDFDYLLYKRGRFRGNKDWEVSVSAVNNAIPVSSSELISIGIEVYNARRLANRASVSLSVSRLEGIYACVAFTQIVINGETVESTYSRNLPEEGKIKFTYSGADGVLTAWYQAPDEDEWFEFGSFGLRGSAGETADVDFGLGGSGQFLVYLYGYSENMTIEPGESTLNDFIVKQ